MDTDFGPRTQTSSDRRSAHHGRLPATTRRKILASYRTAYTTLVCIILTHYWKLGGSATYVAPLLSAISGGSAYFGQWQNDAWKVTYAAVIGGAFGVAIGLSWDYNYFQIILLFTVLTWANRISLWDRLGKVIAAIGIVLGALWPKLSNGLVIGLAPFQYIVLIVCIPYAITGATLLFPRLTLASFAAQHKVSTVCATLNSAVSALVRGFCAADHADLYTAEIDLLVAQLDKDLVELSTLRTFVESEALIFHKLQPFGPALEKFIGIVRLVVDEISSVRDNLDSLLHNRTQAKFVEILRPNLGNLGADMEIVICIADEYLTSAFNIRIYPNFMYSTWSFLNGIAATSFDVLCSRRNQSGASSPSPESRGNGAVRISSMKETSSSGATSSEYFESSSRSVRMKSMYDRRRFFKASSATGDQEEEEELVQQERSSGDVETGDVNQKSTTVQKSSTGEAVCRRKELMQTIERLKTSQSEMIELYRRARAQYVWHSSYATSSENSILSLQQEEETAAVVSAETKLLSFRNLGPRAAILHRTSLLTELICSLDSVINTESSTLVRATYLSSLLSFGKAAVMTIYTYISEVLLATAGNIKYISTVAIPVLLCGRRRRRPTAGRTAPLSPSSSSSPDTARGANKEEYSGRVSSNPNALEKLDADPPREKSALSVDETRYRDVVQEIKRAAWEVRVVYAQSAKIALAVTVTSLFVLVQQTGQMENSLWAVLVVILIRQESTSSSFLTGYQRLEGTVIGSVYAFTMFQIFQCAENACGLEVSTPVLVLWLAVCSFFRDGPRHGYAAIVAGFTPIVLFLGNTPSTADGAWMRVELTFIGIGIYLLIDNLILPNRTDVALRAGVRLSIDETREAMTESFAAVRILMTVGTDHRGLDGEDTQSSGAQDRGDSKLSFGGCKAYSLSQPDTKVYDVDDDLMGRNTNAGRNIKSDRDSTQRCNSSETKTDDIPSPRGAGYFMATSSSQYGGGILSGESATSISVPAMTAAGVTPSSSSTSTSTSTSSEYPRNKDDVLLNFEDKAEQCDSHLESFALSVDRLKALIVKDLTNLSLVMHEPELWQRSFPAEVYKPLLTSFANVMKSTRSVASATKSFSGVLQTMVSMGEGEQVALHLSTYAFMTKHLVAVTKKTDLALRLAADPGGDVSSVEPPSDLTAIVTLSRVCEALQQGVDDYYRQVYSKLDLDFLAQLNPYFLVAFQDLYHSVCAAAKTLSQLGIALRAVRDVEALSAL